MKVNELMTQDTKTCRPETNLAAAGELLFTNDCGCLPVIDENAKVIGIITDRDISIALATRDKRASEITASEVISGRVESCQPEDDVNLALQKMQTHRIRRLPVVNREGVLQGILSLNDIAMRAQESRSRLGGVTFEDLGKAVRAICEPHVSRKPEQAEVRAFAGR